MTDLTEQYLNGNLHDGDEYYIKNKDGEIFTMHLYNDTIHWHSFKVKKLKVLAPVPSYEEWEKLKEFADYSIHNRDELTRQINFWMQENTKLKELLKKARDILEDEGDYMIVQKIKEVFK